MKGGLTMQSLVPSAEEERQGFTNIPNVKHIKGDIEIGSIWLWKDLAPIALFSLLFSMPCPILLVSIAPSPQSLVPNGRNTAATSFGNMPSWTIWNAKKKKDTIYCLFKICTLKIRLSCMHPTSKVQIAYIHTHNTEFLEVEMFSCFYEPINYNSNASPLLSSSVSRIGLALHSPKSALEAVIASFP